MTQKTSKANVPALAGVPDWMQKLRQAVFDGVRETDVKEIVEGIVKRAKEGDAKSITFVFDYLLGGTGVPKSVTQINHHYGQDKPAKAKAAFPRTYP